VLTSGKAFIIMKESEPKTQSTVLDLNFPPPLVQGRHRGDFIK
jgi:hypothetical protein